MTGDFPARDALHGDRSYRVDVYLGHGAPDDFPRRRIFHGHVDRGAYAWAPDRRVHLGTAHRICTDGVGLGCLRRRPVAFETQTNSRMTPEEIVASVVGKLGVPYELIQIDPAFADTAVFC